MALTITNKKSVNFFKKFQKNASAVKIVHFFTDYEKEIIRITYRYAFDDDGTEVNDSELYTIKIFNDVDSEIKDEQTAYDDWMQTHNAIKVQVTNTLYDELKDREDLTGTVS